MWSPVTGFGDGSHRDRLTGFVYASYRGRLKGLWMHQDMIACHKFCGWIILCRLDYDITEVSAEGFACLGEGGFLVF